MVSTPAGDIAAAVRAARAIERWGSERQWRGPDPYDALNATRLPEIARRSPLALRVVTQAVKRSPVNLRPLLGVADGLSAATLANVISAYARNGFLDEAEAQSKLGESIGRLAGLRCAPFSEPCWGYHFDVQTRVFFYPRGTPNTIATAFAGLGLLDAHELAGARGALEMAAGAGEFFMRHVPQTEAEPGAYFGYLPGDRTPIHNANMLVAALLARLGCLTRREEFAGAARAAVEYTVSRQRADGSWPYGEEPHLQWIDGFHTGYVLDCLLTCIDAGVGEDLARRAWQRGLQYYVKTLLGPGGIPRYSATSRYPIDGQCVAQAILTLARAAPREPRLAECRWAVLEYALRRFTRGDGALLFQRERGWVNRIAHPRWAQAPMLEALTHLVASGPGENVSPAAPRTTAPASTVRAIIKAPAVQRILQTERGARLVQPAPRFLAAQVARRPTGRYALPSGVMVHLRHNSRDVDMLNEIFGKGCYDPPPGPVADTLKSGPIRVLDLGGNIGLFAAYALGRWEVAAVRSYEPDPVNSRLLSATIAANDTAGRWSLQQNAVSNRSGTLWFVPGRLAESRMAEAHEDGIEVPMVDLYDVDHDVELLKMDIEGAEWSIITDPRLPTLRARTIVMEWHARFCPSTEPYAAARELLLGAGYRVFLDRPSDHMQTGLLWVGRI